MRKRHTLSSAGTELVYAMVLVLALSCGCDSGSSSKAKERAGARVGARAGAQEIKNQRRGPEDKGVGARGGPAEARRGGEIPAFVLSRFGSVPSSAAFILRARVDLFSRRLPSVKAPLVQQALGFMGNVVSSDMVGVDVRSDESLKAWGLEQGGGVTISAYGDVESWKRSAATAKKVFTDPTQAGLPMRVLFAKVPNSFVGIRTILPLTDAPRFLSKISELVKTDLALSTGFVTNVYEPASLGKELDELRQAGPAYVIATNRNRLTIGWIKDGKLLQEMFLFVRRFASLRELAATALVHLRAPQAAHSKLPWMAQMAVDQSDLAWTLDASSTAHLARILGMIQALGALVRATPHEMVVLAAKGGDVALNPVKLVEASSTMFAGHVSRIRVAKGRLSWENRWKLTPLGSALLKPLLSGPKGIDAFDAKTFGARFVRPLVSALAARSKPRGAFAKPLPGVFKLMVDGGFFSYFLFLGHFWVDMLRYAAPWEPLGFLVRAHAGRIGLRSANLSLSGDHLVMRLE